MATAADPQSKFRLLRRLRIDQTYLDGLPVAFCVSDVVDPSQPMLFASTGFEQLTGYALSETIGRNCNFLQGPHTDMKTRKFLARAIADAKGVTVIILNYRRDRRRYWSMLKMEPLRSSNASTNPRYFVGIQVDVTDYLSASPDQLYGTGDSLPPVLPQFAEVMKAKPDAMERVIRGVASSLALSAPPMIRGPNGGRLPVFFGPPTFVDGIPGLPSGFTISDARQQGLPLVFASDGFLAMTGYSVEEALGKNCKYLQGRDTAELTIDELRSAIKEARAITRVVLNYRRDGTPFYNMLTIAPVLGRESARRLARRLRRAQRKFLSEVKRRGADDKTLEVVKQGMALAGSSGADDEDAGPVPIMGEAGIRLPDAIINLNVASDDEQDDLAEDARRLAHKSPDQGLKPLYYIGLQIDVSDYPDLVEPPEGDDGAFVIRPKEEVGGSQTQPPRPHSAPHPADAPPVADRSRSAAALAPANVGGGPSDPRPLPASGAAAGGGAGGPVRHTVEIEATTTSSAADDSGRQRASGGSGVVGGGGHDTRPEARRQRALAVKEGAIEQVFDAQGRPASPRAEAVFADGEGEEEDDYAALEAELDGQIANREAAEEAAKAAEKRTPRRRRQRKRPQAAGHSGTTSQGTTRSSNTSEDDAQAKQVASNWLRRHGLDELADTTNQGLRDSGAAGQTASATTSGMDGAEGMAHALAASSVSSLSSKPGHSNAQGTVVPPTGATQGGPIGHAGTEPVNTAAPYRREKRGSQEDAANSRRSRSSSGDKEKCSIQ